MHDDRVVKDGTTEQLDVDPKPLERHPPPIPRPRASAHGEAFAEP